jgi:hypothetical protein
MTPEQRIEAFRAKMAAALTRRRAAASASKLRMIHLRYAAHARTGWFVSCGL